MMSVPLMSLVMSPVIAAAIMLPLLLVMDAFSIFAWRKNAAWHHLMVLLPGALVGIIIGALSARYVSENMVRLIVGVIAVSFFFYSLIPKKELTEIERGKSNRLTGGFWGSIAGFTSYIAHAGSPPYHVYLIPKKLSKGAFAATGAWFFAIVNVIKLPAFIITGQLNMATFYQALVFVPLVPVGVYCGLWLNKRFDHELFYKVIMAAVLLIGLKLIIDGLSLF